jgi:hypothetical protein
MTLAGALVQLAAALPDPGTPAFPALCGGYGGFAAGLVARLRKQPVGPRVTGGTVVGFGIGLVCWLVALAIDRL